MLVYHVGTKEVGTSVCNQTNVKVNTQKQLVGLWVVGMHSDQVFPLVVYNQSKHNTVANLPNSLLN